MFDSWSKQSGPTEAPSFSIVTWTRGTTGELHHHGQRTSVQVYTQSDILCVMSKLHHFCQSMFPSVTRAAYMLELNVCLIFGTAIYIVTIVQNQVEFFFIKSRFLKLIVKGDKEALHSFRSQNHNRNLRTCFKIAHSLKKKTKPKTISV